MNAPPPLSILLTNVTLMGRSGTEVMTAELAATLHRRGHDVMVYTPRLGPLAKALSARGIPVVDRIADINTRVDVIHGHHNLQVAIALVRFPKARALFVCHDTSSIHDQPILSPRIGQYVGVDRACERRLLAEGAPRERTSVITNGVDLSRFTARERCRARPRSALAVTKSRAPWLATVRTACAIAGIALTEVGPGVDHSVTDLAERMLAADVVFAWSRSAIEAAATGAAVILCDEYGFGGLLTSAEARLFPDNELSRRNLAEAVTIDGLLQALEQYDADDALEISRVVHRRFALDHMADAYEALYRAQMDLPDPDAEDGERTVAGFLEDALPRYEIPAQLQVTGRMLIDRLARLNAWVADASERDHPCVRTIAFNLGGLGPTLLGSGWYPPEQDWVWTRGSFARLDMPTALCRAWGGQLSFRADHYFLASDEPRFVRAVDVRVGGLMLARWNFVRSNFCDLSAPCQILAIPSDLLVGDTVPIDFEITGPARPFDSTGAPDHRLLGLMLRSVAPSP